MVKLSRHQDGEAFQGAVVSKLIVANSRMQARIYKVLNTDQKKKLEQLRRANAVTADTE